MYHRITVKPRFWQYLALVLVGLAMRAGAVQGEPVFPDAFRVGSVTLLEEDSATDSAMLDVGLVIFDPGIPADPSSHSRQGIFPEIRKAEAQLVPVLLRRALVAANAWGVVRVLPEEQQSAELLVTGKILHSDGLQLALQVRALDATGRQWLDKVYLDQAGESDYPVRPGNDPYADLYAQVANDLLTFRRQLERQQLAAIRQVALMRYAAGLSEEAFGSYLERDAAGTYTLVRLPAQGDPMMARVDRIRNQEHLFIDTVDEQYVELYEQMVPTYNLWRQYGREQAIYKEEFQARAQNREHYGRRGTFVAMEQTYNTYKQIKIQEQDLDEMALGFNNEVTPTVMEASGRVFRLTGTLATQYSEWRGILRKIFALETGLPDVSP